MFPVNKLLFLWKFIFIYKEIPLYSKEVLAGFGTQISSDSHLVDPKYWYTETSVLMMLR